MTKRENYFMYFGSLLVLTMFLISSCDEDSNTSGGQGLPVLTTAAVADITESTAVSGGEVVEDGGFEISARGVCWATQEDPTIEDLKTEDGTGLGAFVSNLSDLELGTTYYVRAYAINANGTGYGNVISFTAGEQDEDQNGENMEITTIEPFDITSSSATSGGIITYLDEMDVVEIVTRGISWSTDENPDLNDNFTEEGTGDGEFESLLMSLEPNTTYYVRAYATTENGTSFGKQVSFTTESAFANFPGLAYHHRTNPAASWVYEDTTAQIAILEEDDLPRDRETGELIDEYLGLDLIGFSITGIFLDDDEDGLWDGVNSSVLKFWIDIETNDLIIPAQNLGCTWNLGAALGGADEFHEIIIDDLEEVELDLELGEIHFSGAMRIGISGYWFNVHTFLVIPEYYWTDDIGGDKASTFNVGQFQLEKR